MASPAKPFKYRLYHLNGRGRAELIRYIFAYSGRPFDDCRMKLSEWKKVKQEFPEGIPLPFLVIDQTQMLTGALAIARFLAREFGLCGRNNWEAAEADMLVEGVAELYPSMTPVLRATLGKQEQKKKAAWEVFKATCLNEFLEQYTEILKNNKTGWFVGSRVTWADLAVAELLSRFETCFDSMTLKEYPELKTHLERVEKLPRLKTWIDTRPHSLF